MGAVEGRSRFAFLYQTERGTIDAGTWARGAAPVAALLIALTAIWLAVRPFTARGLDQRVFLDPVTLAANLYLLVYMFAAILLAISWVNLSAKRFRDRGRTPPVGFAGILPIVVLLDGAIRWLQPQIADSLPRAIVYGGDGLVAVALAWTVRDCLLPRPDHETRRVTPGQG